MANAASQMLQYRIDSKQIEQYKYRSDLFKRQLDIQDTEARRQIDVAKSRGDTATADMLKQKAESNALLTPEQRESRLMLQVDVAKANQENNNLRTQIGAAQQQNQLYQQQLGFMEFQQKISTDTEDKWAAAGPEIASAIGEIKKAMMTNSDPNERGALFDRYNALQDQGTNIIAEQRAQAQKDILEGKRTVAPSQLAFSAREYGTKTLAVMKDLQNRNINKFPETKVFERQSGERSWIKPTSGAPTVFGLSTESPTITLNKTEASELGYNWETGMSVLTNDKSTAARDTVTDATSKIKTKSKVKKVKTQEEYDAIPKGDEFIDTDGKRKVKR